MSPHQQTDVLYYIAFFLGQCLFVLKRADLAARSNTNGTPTKMAYLGHTWVTLLVRMVLEFVLVYYPYRHLSINDLFSSWGWHFPFQIPQSAVGAFCLGYLSDSLLDWMGTRQTFPGTNITIPKWLKEQVPPLTFTIQTTVVSNVTTTNTTTSKTVASKLPLKDGE
jgi:hypothetical protein